MNKKELSHFKDKLLKEKERILNSGILGKSEELAISSDDLSDEADLANNVISQQINFSLRDKELAKIKMIDYALYKVDNGDYGLCEECDDPIENKRLENQPWAELCIVHAEEKEKESQHSFRRSY